MLQSQQKNTAWGRVIMECGLMKLAGLLIIMFDSQDLGLYRALEYSEE